MPSASASTERHAGRTCAAVAVVGLLQLAVCPPAASASSLPTVGSGARPGPALLYAPRPRAPELSVKRPFRAAPLLVSGTDAYRNGEYV